MRTFINHLASICSILGIATAGTASLGTLSANPLPPFLTNNPLPNGFPWGSCTANNTSPKNPPVTGTTRYYDFTVRRGTAAPDGFQKNVLLINDQFPGPTIEANWGDWIQVTLRNQITGPEEGTSLHWHGLLQKETPWYDGVPSVSQCPVAPGSTFTYRFRADVYGTTWYHSHYSAQYAGGLLGPLVIYGPSYIPYDYDLGPILLQDWFHLDYFALVEHAMSNITSLQSQASDNTLINGRMPYNCSSAVNGTSCSSNASYSKYRVKAGKTYRLRLINSGAGGIQYFSIDDHSLTVISNDFVYVEPYNTNFVTLGIGQRSDVLFTPKGGPNDTYWMRTLQSGLFCARARQPEGRAVILLDNAPEDTIPKTLAWPPPIDDRTCKNDPLSVTIPYYQIALPEPSVTYHLVINEIINATGHKLYTMNGSPFQADYSDPILRLANEKNISYPHDPQWNIIDFGTNTSIRVNVWNNFTAPHPMHLHGHDMYMLHEGPGQWDGTTIINPQNPQRRDTQNLIPNGHMVFQFDADNPGAWPFHCHIAWHLSMVLSPLPPSLLSLMRYFLPCCSLTPPSIFSHPPKNPENIHLYFLARFKGLSVTFVERPADIPQPQIPGIMSQTCDAWDRYSSRNVVDQIDSGF
ncbi:hypothetical protein MMC12_001853 [Toensbergia leucococca]|nr:hypothetical protein [Toensbergia leucococca]